MNCIICSGQTRLLFSTKDRASAGEVRALRWCDTCDFGRLDGDFTPQTIASFYPENYYTHFAAPRHAGRMSPLERLRVHLAWRFDDGKPLNPAEIGAGRTVCDLGCGNGSDLRLFAEHGYRATGIDPDPKARAAAMTAGEILAGTAEDLPAGLAGRTFDVVLMSHVLEHCIDPTKAISNAASLLAPGGRLVVEVPNNAALGFSTFRAAWPWSDIPRHLNFFTDRSLEKLLRQRGLSVSRTSYVGYTRQFMPAWISMQKRIWSNVADEPMPSFGLAAWVLLFRSALAPRRRKFDSVRVQATR